MTPVLAAAAAVAALGIVGAGGWFALRRKPDRIASPEEAAQAAEAALPGFVVAGAVVGADGAGAIAVTANGRVAAVARQGRKLAVEEVAWQSLRAGGGGMVVEARRLGAVALAGVNVLDIRRLAPGYKGD